MQKVRVAYGVASSSDSTNVLGVAGNKHPTLMGTGFRGPFVELWDSVSAIFAECRKTGNSAAVTEQMLPIERHGFLEETFYTWVCQISQSFWDLRGFPYEEGILNSILLSS